jgi:hypothetical protein
MINRLRRWFEDMGPFVVGAAVLFVCGSLFLGANIQSPGVLQWTGTEVHAVESGGISYYSFRGEKYTLDVTSRWVQPDTVYLDPDKPDDAVLGNPVLRWTEFAAVAGPYAASVLLLAFGFARRSRRRRLRRLRPEGAYGSGLDVQTLRRLRDRQRSGTVRDEDQADGGDR